MVIPFAVWQEIKRGISGDNYTDLKQVSYISIERVKNLAAVGYLTDLDEGEAEVIVLAREVSADLVIIDEKLGRSYAKHFKLNLTGTLGILLKAKNEGYIPEVKPLLTLLKSKGIWISDSVFDEVLLLAGEK